MGKMRLKTIYVTEIFCVTVTIVCMNALVSTDDKQELKELPIGIKSIHKIITEGYVYVDKTSSILKLLQGPDKFVFLTRPKQFGRSLLTDTMGEIFAGKNKAIFENTMIGRSRYEWTEYPVVKIDLSRIARNFLQEFFRSVRNELKQVEKFYGISELGSSGTPNITEYFVDLLRALNEKCGKPVVMLIEEYDCTFAEEFGLPGGAKEIAKSMQSFYKAMEFESKIIRFCFITTITELSKAASFSGFDDIGLVDISAAPEYADIAGFTIDEIAEILGAHVEAIAQHDKISKEDIYKEITTWYKGQQFSSQELLVYNPYTILTHLQFKRKNDVFGYKWGMNIDIKEIFRKKQR